MMVFAMNNAFRPVILGEVLFDCFPTGEKILGGAPFNVAWHLQAFGDYPRFVSRVGNDEMGEEIINAISDWGMDMSSLQIDSQHRTGQVEVEFIDDEPHYNIKPDCAYDFIEKDELGKIEHKGILYHGTLALRNKKTLHAFHELSENSQLSIFMDVNLRTPWWKKDQVNRWLKKARWVKLNHDELKDLASTSGNIKQDMAEFQNEHDLELLILTLGAEGAMVRTYEGELHSVAPSNATQFVDTVGAGDAFTAVFLHGLISKWPIVKTLEVAQQFASTVVGIRGATSDDVGFYENFKQ